MSELTLQVNSSLSVCILPSKEHEFLMTSKEVALGYGVTESTIRSNMANNRDELAEGKHFVKGVQIMDTLGGSNQQPNQTFWTKRGIVRLGFFIKSDRARQFRDWAEDIVIFAGQSGTAHSVSAHLVSRISALEDSIARLTAMLPAPARPAPVHGRDTDIIIPAVRPSFEELKTSLRVIADRWLRMGDLKRIAELHGIDYRHVSSANRAPHKSKRVTYLIYEQCVANMRTELSINQ